MIVTDDLPQLRQLLRNRAVPEVCEEEAFELSETNRGWRPPWLSAPSTCGRSPCLRAWVAR